MSLLEVLLAIGVSAGILVAVTHYYLSTTLSLSVTQSITQIQNDVDASYQWLQANHQADFQGDGTTSTPISLEALQAAGLLPTNAQVNPWGGRVSLGPAPSQPNFLQISSEQIPTAACIQLSARMQNIAQSAQCVGSHQFIGIF